VGGYGASDAEIAEARRTQRKPVFRQVALWERRLYTLQGARRDWALDAIRTFRGEDAAPTTTSMLSPPPEGSFTPDAFPVHQVARCAENIPLRPLRLRDLCVKGFCSSVSP